MTRRRSWTIEAATQSSTIAPNGRKALRKTIGAAFQ